MRWCTSFWLVLFLLLAPSSAIGQCAGSCNSAYFTFGSTAGSGTYTVQCSHSAGNHNICLNINLTGNGAYQFVITVQDTGVSIRNLDITVTHNPGVPSSGQWAEVSVVRNLTSDSIARIERVRRMVGSTASLRFGCVVQGDIGDPASPIQDLIDVSAVTSISAGGKIYSDIITRGPSAGDTQTAGGIGRIVSFSNDRGAGAIQGDITSFSSISEIVADAGHIGSSGSPAGVMITSSGNIELIRAWRVYASINTGIGSLERLQTVEQNNDGHFGGSLTTVSVDNPQAGVEGIRLTGRFEALTEIAGNIESPVVCGSIINNITVGGSVASTGSITAISLAAGNVLKIGGSLDANLLFTSGTGLAGQVIIGADGGLSAPWAGGVTVGSVGLLPRPHYPQASSALGGGAVGEVPYSIYYGDCSPSSDSYFRRGDFEPSGGDKRGVLIRFYGPIIRGPGDQAVVVERQFRDDFGVSIWGDCTPMFTATVGPGSVVNSARTMRVHYSGTTGHVEKGRYRIRVVPDGVQCGGLSTAIDVDTSVYYYFNIGLDCSSGLMCTGSSIGPEDFIDPESTWNPLIDCDGNNIDDVCELACDAAYVDKDGDGDIDMCDSVMDCACDVNMSGFLNSQDFFDYVNCFFGTCLSGQDADFNNDTFVNSQDFFDFLTCFFAGC